jgi:hypothetical protein
MALKKSRRKGGRPYNPNSKRHFKSRFGRKQGYERMDPGSAELRVHKRRLTGREDLPIDPAGVLLGRALIDAEQYRCSRLSPNGYRAWSG